MHLGPRNYNHDLPQPPMDVTLEVAPIHIGSLTVTYPGDSESLHARPSDMVAPPYAGAEPAAAAAYEPTKAAGHDGLEELSVGSATIEPAIQSEPPEHIESGAGGEPPKPPTRPPVSGGAEGPEGPEEEPSEPAGSAETHTITEANPPTSADPVTDQRRTPLESLRTKLTSMFEIGQEARQEARDNASYAASLREQISEAISSPDVREAIGTERASSLLSIARGMGVLALAGTRADVHKRSSQAAQNGVYLAPVTPDMAGSTIQIPFEGSNAKWIIPSLREGDTAGAQHSTLRKLPGVHLITVSTETGISEQPSRTAMLAHELTHTRQAENTQDWNQWHESDIKMQVANEAEAYDVQFHVLDTFLEGALSAIYDASKTDGNFVGKLEDKVLVVPKGLTLPDGRSTLNNLEAWTVIHYAHNRIGGYDLSHPSFVPQELIDIYLSENGNIIRGRIG